MTRQDGLLARRRWHVGAVGCRRTTCHQMHLSERGDERAARLTLKFKVTPCDWDSSPPRRGNRRKRWVERKNKGKVVTFPSTRTQTHTQSYTKHFRCSKGPFINAYINTAKSKDLTVTPRGYCVLYTIKMLHRNKHPDDVSDLRASLNSKRHQNLKGSLFWE